MAVTSLHPKPIVVGGGGLGEDEEKSLPLKIILLIVSNRGFGNAYLPFFLLTLNFAFVI